jgi:hypothetical protein
MLAQHNCVQQSQLDEYLVSSYSQVRWKLVHNLIKEHSTGKIAPFKQELVFSFLDSVLDNSFKVLNIGGSEIAFLSEAGHLTRYTQLPFKDPELLLEIVAHHSTLLKCLNLAFTMPSQTAPLSPAFCLQLGKLIHLTSLRLSFKTSDNCIDLFINLGQSLPQLTVLRLAKFHLVLINSWP